MTKDGVLVIRWQLPSGTEVDTGFRGDDKTVYPLVGGRDERKFRTVTITAREISADADSSGEVEQNGENA